MDIILNFASLRPIPTASPVLTAAADSDFQRALAALGGDDVLSEARALARDVVQTRFLADARDAAHGPPLTALLRQLRGGDVPASGRLAAEIDRAVGGASAESFAADVTRARDSVVAGYLLNGEPSAAVAMELVRAYTLAAEVRAGEPTEQQVASILSGPMALPDEVLRLRDSTPTPPSAPSPEQVALALAEQIDAVAARRARLADALDQIDLHAEDELVQRELGEQRLLDTLHRPTDTGRRPADDGQDDGLESTSAALRASTGRNVHLSDRAVELLSAPAAQTLRDLNLDPTTAQVTELRGRLAAEHEQAGQQLMDLAGRFAGLTHIVPFGDARPAPVIDPTWLFEPVDAPEVFPPVATAAPTSHATIAPLGVADLMLVRAHVSHYERAEVAAVESVLAHEKLTHTARRLDTADTTVTDDAETTDLGSRAQTLAEQDSWHSTVQAVGPGIGPLAAEAPGSFARSVTDQVSSDSSNRRRRLTVGRQLREREDTVEHLLDNAATAAGAHGVYQGLDVVYSAQTFSYGTRLLYDLVVPEPAAVFREALARPRGGGTLPVRPARFSLAPTGLTAENWAYYVAGHHAGGVEPPPPRRIVVTEPFGSKAKDAFADVAAANSVVVAESRSTRIPKGYRAARYRLRVLATSFADGFVRVMVGAKSEYITPANNSYARAGALDGEVETVPVGILVGSTTAEGPGVQAITVGVEIVCEATDELVAAWQVRAHNQILEGNRRRFQDYEERVANRDASARIFLQGLSPAAQTSIIRTEMKRAALEVLTAQSFGGFTATRPDAAGFPFPDPAATAGLSAYIRFFEQAVEWEHLAYAFHPYFWGSQASWVSKLVTADDGPFATFLTSGAARVVLPIRRGYEAAVERFLHTGATPTTGELLDLGSPLWVSLVDELRHRGAEDGRETAVGEPWPFRVPSDLVWARPDGSMPRWSTSQGVWSDTADPSF